MKAETKIVIFLFILTTVIPVVGAEQGHNYASEIKSIEYKDGYFNIQMKVLDPGMYGYLMTENGHTVKLLTDAPQDGIWIVPSSSVNATVALYSSSGELVSAMSNY